ncbi:RNA polymerase sigma factor [Flavivirga eckloniae]|uniref:RNA polymerase sigma-70 factor n=1 Tax=Flavivirga eckloniae TaxID=1803846 RepID=A0A2K9PPC3_9FLAO|nr:RNA polymerase sigma-70 factor [Flavivirga eckloniae]AUP78921.1 RNA polymerase sigma-70 factor [Flavivirga eckloniae]
MGDFNILLAALKNGDDHAFEKIYADHYELLCFYLLSYTSDKAKVEDIVQETFITLWSKRKEINITTSLKNYLIRIAYNKLTDTYRKSKKKDEMLSSYYQTALMRAINLDNDEKNERLLKLDKCIDKLPKKCRDVFKENKIKGMKYSQVAENMNISIKTVEGHITNAFRLIRSCMKVNS